MGHLENVLNKVKEKIDKYTETKKHEDVKYKVEPKILEKANYERVIDLDGEVEDWYHDVGVRGGFKS